MQNALEVTTDDLKYRPDIDGLRAIAVLAVLGFHAFPEWFSGGFVGVDVFFVISGFLISTIILTGIQRKTFNFGTFYRKRIRRIFPALLLVLISCYLFGWFTLIGMEYQALGKHILGGVGFASNFILLEESGYFDKEATLKPLLHLWSLSIEEQFYIFWPVFLVLIRKLRVPLVLSLGVMVCLSFGINIANLTGQPATAFYHPFGRAWELAIGGLLAVLFLFHRHHLSAVFTRLCNHTTVGKVRLRQLLSVSGLTLIVVAIFCFNSEKEYPGWWALMPITGTLLIIAAGKEAWLNKRLLSHPIIVGIGLISFPLYLWHWPLISYLHIFNGEMLSFSLRVAALGLSFFLAILTYHFVEKPLRTGNVARLSFHSSVLCIGLVTMGYIGLLSWAKYIAPRSGSYGLEKFSSATTEWEFPVEGVGGIGSYGGNLKPLQFEGSTFYIQSSQLKRKVLYIGDSQMQVFSGRIIHLISSKPQNLSTAVFATKVGCPPIQNIKRTKWTYHSCENFPQTALSYADNNEIETVVFGALWSGYFQDDLFYYDEGANKKPQQDWNKGSSGAYKELESMLLTLKQKKKRVYIVLEAPMGQALNPAKMVMRDFDIKKLKFDFKVDELARVTKTELSKTTGSVNERIREIARRTGAVIIDPKTSLCGTESCFAIDKRGEPIYKDEWHIRPTYMREHGSFMDQTLSAARP